MSRYHSAGPALVLAAAGLFACAERGEGPEGRSEQANQSAEAPATPPLKQPPMVVSSPAYRCDDGQALYVDVMNDDSFVSVRDSRQDLPTRLDRNPETQRFEGEGRTLSGRGETVRYAAPDRPEQACRVAAG